MDRDEEITVCLKAIKGSRVTLRDGRRGSVVLADAELGSIWVLLDGANADLRIWASQVARFS